MKKRIVLCADDYGQAPHISNAILSLIERKRITATSCLVNFEAWRSHSNWLQEFKQQAFIGLHLNLTEGRPLSKTFIKYYGNTFLPLREMIKRSMLRRLHPQVILAELKAQYEHFNANFGFVPDFIDGHEYIHQLPVVREALLTMYQEYNLMGVYIRNTYSDFQLFPSVHNFKKVLLNCFGAIGLKRMLKRNNIPHNTSLEGIYSFSKAKDYARLFPRFLSKSQHKGMIVCHPGLKSNSGDDPLLNVRHFEFDYFSSDAFVRDCEIYGIDASKRGSKYLNVHI